MSQLERFLVVYSAILTTALAVVVGFLLRSSKPAAANELTVHRLNVVEPDGTLRMVISNHDRLPGIIKRGKERPFERPQAGIIFLNDEGTETGGLIFGGRRNEKGEIENAGASLSFDRYESNQIVQLIGVDDHENRFAGLSVGDSPSGNDVRRRIWLGRRDDGAATLALSDGNGKKRVQLQVTAEGEVKFVLLDEEGTVVRDLLAAGRP